MLSLNQGQLPTGVQSVPCYSITSSGNDEFTLRPLHQSLSFNFDSLNADEKDVRRYQADGIPEYVVALPKIEIRDALNLLKEGYRVKILLSGAIYTVFMVPDKTSSVYAPVVLKRQ